jgi:hypothetical protein
LPALWPALDAWAALMAHRSRMKSRCTKLTKAEQGLLRKLQRGTWRAAELDWVLAHLPADAPTLLVQQLHSKLIEVQESVQAPSPPN